MKTFIQFLFLIHTLYIYVDGFYLPGVAPHSFQTDEEVELKVNKLR